MGFPEEWKREATVRPTQEESYCFFRLDFLLLVRYL